MPLVSTRPDVAAAISTDGVTGAWVAFGTSLGTMAFGGTAPASAAPGMAGGFVSGATRPAGGAVGIGAADRVWGWTFSPFDMAIACCIGSISAEYENSLKRYGSGGGATEVASVDEVPRKPRTLVDTVAGNVKENLATVKDNLASIGTVGENWAALRGFFG